ncbi:MAG: hypothetical protein MUC87_01290 [Bacteroidia bacterium]|nr:hypothetical protein [Bacteroidia bacterium]
MFIRLARQNTPPAIVLIVVVGILLWAPALFVQAAPLRGVQMPLFAFAAQFAAGFPLASKVVALLVLLGEAFLLNYIVQQHQLLTKKSWLPALLTVVLGSATADLLQLSAPLLALLPLLLALHVLAGTYRLNSAFSQVFNSGVLISIAALIYLPAAIFLVFAFAALVLLRPFIWREWMILLFGFLLPWIYVSVWYYWHDNLAVFYRDLVLQPVLQRDFFLKLPAEAYPLTAIVGLLLLTAIGRFVAGSGTATMKTRKGISLMNWFLFTGLLALLPAQHFGAATLLPVLPPLAFVTANYFLLARRLWMAEVLFGILILAVIIGYKPWL